MDRLGLLTRIRMHEAMLIGFGVSPIQGTDGFNEDSLHDR